MTITIASCCALGHCIGACIFRYICWIILTFMGVFMTSKPRLRGMNFFGKGWPTWQPYPQWQDQQLPPGQVKAQVATNGPPILTTTDTYIGRLSRLSSWYISSKVVVVVAAMVIFCCVGVYWCRRRGERRRRRRFYRQLFADKKPHPPRALRNRSEFKTIRRRRVHPSLETFRTAKEGVGSSPGAGHSMSQIANEFLANRRRTSDAVMARLAMMKRHQMESSSPTDDHGMDQLANEFLANRRRTSDAAMAQLAMMKRHQMRSSKSKSRSQRKRHQMESSPRDDHGMSQIANEYLANRRRTSDASMAQLAMMKKRHHQMRSAKSESKTRRKRSWSSVLRTSKVSLRTV